MPALFADCAALTWLYPVLASVWALWGTGHTPAFEATDTGTAWFADLYRRNSLHDNGIELIGDQGLLAFRIGHVVFA